MPAQLDSGVTLGGPATPAAGSISFATTMTPTVSGAGAVTVVNITLTASTGTIANPSGTPADGQQLRFRLTQGTGGSFTVAWGSSYDFGSSGAPTLTTTAAKVDLVAFEYVSSLSKWCFLGMAAGN